MDIACMPLDVNSCLSFQSAREVSRLGNETKPFSFNFSIETENGTSPRVL